MLTLTTAVCETFNNSRSKQDDGTGFDPTTVLRTPVLNLVVPKTPKSCTRSRSCIGRKTKVMLLNIYCEDPLKLDDEAVLLSCKSDCHRQRFGIRWKGQDWKE